MKKLEVAKIAVPTYIPVLAPGEEVAGSIHVTDVEYERILNLIHNFSDLQVLLHEMLEETKSD